MTDVGLDSLTSLRRGPLVDLAVRHLREQITSGAWPVGGRLPTEMELAGALGVGRSTVREAVRVLVHAGLLDTRQGVGTFVTATSAIPDWDARLRRARVLEVYEVRQALELKAAVLAAERRTPQDIERIERALAERNRTRAGGSNVDFVDADLAFHRAVVAAAHNPLLEDVFAFFATALREGLLKLVADELADARDSGHHDRLTAAISAGDAAAAARATAENLEVTADRVRRLMDG